MKYLNNQRYDRIDTERKVLEANEKKLHHERIQNDKLRLMQIEESNRIFRQQIEEKAIRDQKDPNNYSLDLGHKERLAQMQENINNRFRKNDKNAENLIKYLETGSSDYGSFRANTEESPYFPKPNNFTSPNELRENKEWQSLQKKYNQFNVDSIRMKETRKALELKEREDLQRKRQEEVFC